MDELTSKPDRRSRTSKMAVIVGLLIYCFAFQGWRGVWEPDEGRYSAIALGMLDLHDWIHPYINHETIHWAKPPMIYWTVASSVLIFGKSELALRLPSILGFLASILCAYSIGKLFLINYRWLAAVIYATFMFPVAASNILTTDGLVTALENMAVCFFINSVWGNKKHSILYIYLMWMSFGFSFLTKGPPGIIPLLVIFLFAFLSKGSQAHVDLKLGKGLLLFAIIGFSWFFVIILENIRLAGYYFWDEFILRIFSSSFSRNSEWYQPLFIYLPILLFGTLPWSYYALKGIKECWGAPKISHSKERFLLLWFFVPLVIFTLSSSRLPLYILPLFLPLAIMAAKAFEQRKIDRGPFVNKIILWCLVMLILRVIVANLPTEQDTRQFYAKIKRIVPETIDEIVFYDTQPFLGLHFYAAAEVESVTKDAAYTGLRKEISENENRLWVIEAGAKEMFERFLAENQLKMEYRGTIQWDKDYDLFLDLLGKDVYNPTVH